MKGTVKFFHDQKNYGFIETEELEDDVFFHKDELDEEFDVGEGSEVEFEQEEADKGPKAVNVTQA